MRPELLMKPEVAPLGEEIVVDLAEHGREAIRVLFVEHVIAFDEPQAIAWAI